MSELNRGLLKIRAWNDELGKFVYSQGLTFGEEEFYIEFPVKAGYPETGWRFDCSIGLRDSNGTDIYLNDIVRIDNGETTKRLLVNHVNIDAEFMRHWANYKVTIIGNIHQTPHLRG